MFGRKKRDAQKKDARVSKNKVAGGAVEYIGNTKIAYEPQLIKQFQEEHSMLVNSFLVLEKAVHNKDVDRIKLALSKFSKLLRAHLLKENLKLYVYLSHAVKGNPDNGELVHAYKKEMQHIGRDVNGFVSKYSESDLGRYELQEMAGQLGAIKEVLLERISNEEEILYPLYMSPSSYS